MPKCNYVSVCGGIILKYPLFLHDKYMQQNRRDHKQVVESKSW